MYTKRAFAVTFNPYNVVFEAFYGSLSNPIFKPLREIK